MIGALTLTALWRPAARHTFGLVNAGWPCHRLGRRTVSASVRGTGPERVFRNPAPTPVAIHAPSNPVTNIAVTQITLAPRLELLWQSFTKTATAIAAQQDGATWEQSQITQAQGPADTAEESLVARRQRIFLSRLWPSAMPKPDRALRSSPPNPQSTGLRIYARGARPAAPVDLLTPMAGPLGTTVDAQYRPVRRQPVRCGHLRFATARLQNRAEITTHRAATHCVTTVALRVHRLNLGQKSFEPDKSGANQGANLRYLSSEVTARVFADRPNGHDVHPISPTDMPRVPTERRFRAAPHPAPVVPPAAPSPPATTLPEKKSNVDVSKLERVMWQRFEKRLRIEQERRGRT